MKMLVQGAVNVASGKSPALDQDAAE